MEFGLALIALARSKSYFWSKLEFLLAAACDSSKSNSLFDGACTGLESIQRMLDIKPFQSPVKASGVQWTGDL